MKSDPDSNNKPKAYIRKQYLDGRLPAGSYLGEYLSIQEIKDRYGLKYYKRITNMVNDFLNRRNKMACISKKITF